jgi:hypothetical protein
MSEMQAVIDVISSYNLFPEEDKRINYLNLKVDENNYITSYMRGYTLEELKEERKQLRNESNLRLEETNIRLRTNIEG